MIALSYRVNRMLLRDQPAQQRSSCLITTTNLLLQRLSGYQLTRDFRDAVKNACWLVIMTGHPASEQNRYHGLFE